MQIIRMTLTKLQQDPTQTPVMSRVGSRPKKIICHHDYNDKRDKVGIKSYLTHIYPSPYPSVEQQIQIHDMLSRQFYEEEQAKFRQKISKLTEKKSEEHFDWNSPQSIQEQNKLL